MGRTLATGLSPRLLEPALTHHFQRFLRLPVPQPSPQFTKTIPAAIMSTNTTIPFSFPPSLASFLVSPDAYLTANPALAGLIVSTVIIHKHRVLLIQRAAHDGFPLKWECPGGQVDETDETVLHGLCREVFEETALVVTHVVDVADTLEFDGREGGRWRKVTFLVILDDGEVPVVRLSAEEHEDAVWAAEEEVIAGKCEGREIEFAYEGQRQTVLDALRRAG